ncbi:MAG: lipoprotein signal peptidase [Bacteroidetes bacterium]|nr:MAG: lipoprotein signal peptidase [Bacteroidota bacterium]
MNIWKYFGLSLAIIITDQIIKICTHLYMIPGYNGEIQLVGDLFKLHYTLNPGMAMGIELGTQYGKSFLTIFRIFAMFAISYYLYTLIKKQSPKGLIICIAMILGGAVGNVIDSTFYGIWFSNAPFDAPSPWFNGQVIDMFYLDIWEGYLPDAIPLIGNKYYSLWPIFNFADASIFLAVIFLIIKQKKYFVENEPEKTILENEKV